MSRWRAATLIAVHLAVAGHVAHWYMTGRTLTPVEPSETMQTLGSEARLNAGCVFFIAAIVSTMIFGRFFCGWGCHIVALQDLCTWLLRLLKIPPKPFRSRLLVFMPFAAAIFMFVLPTVARLWMGGQRADLQVRFTTEKFWATFPDWPIAVLTFLVCGFLIVYLLGNKGFCTYACPYGGIFGLADRVSPGKIRVTSACEGCAHCTAVCTSNVRVHEEVRDFGMVVNPRCMKCMDCISVCPKEALYFGFGVPTIASIKTPKPMRRHFDYTWGEELALLVMFVLSAAIFRALYDAVPLLFALGLAAISAYLLLTAFRLVYHPSVALGRIRLRADGHQTRAGLIYRLSAILWIVFLIHCGVVQYLSLQGNRLLQAAQEQRATLAETTPEVASLARSALNSLEGCRRIGLVTPANLLAKLAAANMIAGNPVAAAACYRQAIAHAPRFTAARFELARLELEHEEREEACAQLRIVVEEDPSYPDAAGLLANLLMEDGRAEEALSMLDTLILRHSNEADFALAKGLVLAHSDRLEEALTVTRRTVERWPGNAEAHFNLGSMLAYEGDLQGALCEFERTTELRPQFAAGHFMCAKAALRLSRVDLFLPHLEEARRLEPYNAEYVSVWAAAIKQVGMLTGAISEAEGVAAVNGAARFRLVHLYRAAGRMQDAERLAPEFGALLGRQTQP